MASKKNNYDLIVNVMMLGGRRCGKTSVLAAMTRGFDDALSNTQLTVGPADDDTMDVLEEKRREGLELFARKDVAFTPDDNPNLDEKVYSLFVELSGKRRRICINFVDQPGEWLVNKGEQGRNKLRGRLKESRILMIAIDTPYLMEENGVYNDYRNYCDRITSEIKAQGFLNNGSCMILFVPLKCECYKNDDRMNEVADRVREAYKSLIQDVRKIKGCYCAITPIFTLGGIAFSHFERERGEIVIEEKYKIPTAKYYRPDPKQKEPTPEFCEQPMLYVLAYTLQQAREVKQKRDQKGFFEKLFSVDEIFNFFQVHLGNWPSAEDYMKERGNIVKKIKCIDDGYVILHGNIKGNS